MRVQRRVRMGNYGKLGSPYILNPLLGHMMFIYMYLVVSFLINPSPDLLEPSRGRRNFESYGLKPDVRGCEQWGCSDGGLKCDARAVNNRCCSDGGVQGLGLLLGI